MTGPDFPTRDSVLPFAEAVPDPAAGAVACGNATMRSLSPVLERASCEAAAQGVDLVVNLPEVEWCAGAPECPPDGRFQYNTLVALRGNDGAAVGRYRKLHLYFEPSFNNGSSSLSAPWFESSFGTRFGMLICFDMMFAEPSARMLEQGEVGDVVYSTWWVNMPPFLTAPQVQAGWAQRSGVNLVAAGVGHNGWRSSGSGVYASQEPWPSRTAQHFNSRLQAELSLAVVMRNVTTRSSRAAPRPGAKAERPLSLPPSRWDLHQQVFAAAKGGLTAVSAGGVECEVTTRAAPSSPAQYAAIAAEGVYNGIFPAVMCGACACADTSKPCFLGQNTLTGGARLPGAELRMTLCNATGPASQWRLFGNAAADGGNSTHVRADATWQPVPGRPDCSRASLSLEPTGTAGVLDVLLYGIQAAG